MASYWEGLPLAVLEAMFGGNPIVSTDVGGISEAVTHGEHGLLTPAGDATALAEALQVVIGDRELRERWGRAARHRAESEFQVGVMAQAYERLYRGERLLAAARPKPAAGPSAAVIPVVKAMKIHLLESTSLESTAAGEGPVRVSSSTPRRLPTTSNGPRGRPAEIGEVVTSPLLEIDPEAFRENFDRNPFTIRHRLAGHPLFTLPRLVELARELPADCVEYNAGDIDVGQDPSLTPQTGLSVEETIRRIEECGSWMALKYVERAPAYHELLEACLAEFRVHTEPISPGMDRHEGFIFIGSPGAVTPYHMDPEFNFLLHVNGPKTMRVFPRDDRTLLTEEQIEHFYTASMQRNLPYRMRSRPRRASSSWSRAWACTFRSTRRTG